MTAALVVPVVALIVGFALGVFATLWWLLSAIPPGGGRE